LITRLSSLPSEGDDVIHSGSWTLRPPHKHAHQAIYAVRYVDIKWRSRPTRAIVDRSVEINRPVRCAFVQLG